MKAPSAFIKDLKMVREGLFPVWNSTDEKWYIFWTDVRTKKTRVIYCVENEDETFRPLDQRTILWLANNVAWHLLDMYPDPNDMGNYFAAKKNAKMKKAVQNRVDYRKWWNKEHKTEWKAAYENLKRGITWLPPPDKKKIIIA